MSVAGSNGWYAFSSLVREAIGYAAVEPAMRLRACPNDGEPYSQGPDGGLYCRFDGYRPDGSYVGDYPRTFTFTRY